MSTDSQEHARDPLASPDRHPDDLEQAVRRHVERVVADCRGNLSEAARRLGIYRSSLQRKLRRWSAPEPIARPRWRAE